MHSFNSCLVHCIWSTKNRTPFLTSDLRERLWSYLGGIAKQNKMKPLAVGGAADHVHMLIPLPAALSVAKAIQLLKANSSKWIHEAFPKMRSFEWQEGYGAFSIGVSAIETTVAYILGTRRSIIAIGHFAKSFWPCCVSMVWITTNGCLVDSFVPEGLARLPNR